VTPRCGVRPRTDQGGGQADQMAPAAIFDRCDVDVTEEAWGRARSCPRTVRPCAVAECPRSVRVTQRHVRGILVNACGRNRRGCSQASVPTARDALRFAMWPQSILAIASAPNVGSWYLA